MKNIAYLSVITFAILFTVGCSSVIRPINNIQVKDAYTGSMYKGNYIYGAAMNLAWNELMTDFTKGPVLLNTEDKSALETVEKFNQSIFTKDDLDFESYYVKTGYGQKMIDKINIESKQKFPSKSFKDLELKLRDADFVSYAYFLKEVEYPLAFKETQVGFLKDRVKGFYADSDEQKNNVKIVKYWNDNKFIISLKLKDNTDELFLAKGISIDDPLEVVDKINEYNKEAVLMNNKDNFRMPKLHLEHNRRYNEVEGNYLANLGFEDYYIGVMYENIKFDLDEKGARVENEAVIGMLLGSAMETRKIKIKNLVLDKPFWVVMKRKDSDNPYFILGVNNTELMEKI